MPGIYSITCKVSGNRYIGSTKNLYERWMKHRGLLRRNLHHCRHLQFAWNKYGEEEFEFEVLETCLPEDTILVSREQTWIDKFKKNLYNSMPYSQRVVGVVGTPKKLNPDLVVQIFEDAATGKTCKEIAEEIGCHSVLVSTILRREVWRHVAIPQELLDAFDKQRRLRAGSNGKTGRSLSLDTIHEIHRRLQSGEKARAIAKDIGVSEVSLSRIRTGLSYPEIHAIYCNTAKGP